MRTGKWPLSLKRILASFMFAFCLLALFACGGGPGPERIAFSSNRDGNYEVYIMNADGSGQTNLTNNPGEDDWPAWLPR